MAVATPPVETHPVRPAGRSRLRPGTVISYIVLTLLAILFLMPY